VLAIKKVEKVHFDLFFIKKDKEKNQAFNENQFEIFFKDDFVDYYLRPDYELRIQKGTSGI